MLKVFASLVGFVREPTADARMLTIAAITLSPRRLC